MEDRQADTLAASVAHGVGLATVRIWQANAWSAPVWGSSLRVDVDGVATDLDLGRGVAALAFSTPGRHVVALPGREPIAADVYDATFVGPAAPRLTAATTPPDDAVRLGDAMVSWRHGDDGTEVIWTPPEGGGVLIARRPGGLTVLAADLDGDPFPDVVLWDDQHVVTLRGQEVGPPVWSSGLGLAEGRLLALDVADTEGDRAPELVTVVEVDGDVFAEVNELQPAGSWAYRGRLVAPTPPAQALLGRQDGTPVALLIDDVGDISTLLVDGDAWRLVDTNHPVDLPAAATLSLREVTGDDVPDLIAVAPRQLGLPRTLLVLDRGASPQAWVQRQPAGAWWALGDGDADGVDDVWTMDEGGTVRLLAALGAAPMEFNLGQMPYPGPFIVRPDGANPALVVAGTPSGTWQGAPREQGPWRADDVDVDGLLEGVVALWIDAEPTPGEVTWLGVQVRDGTAYVKRWSRTDGDPTLHELRRVTLGGGTVHDAARCGDTVFVLRDEALEAIAADDLTLRWAEPLPDARHLACSHEGRAVVFTPGAWTERDAAGDVTGGEAVAGLIHGAVHLDDGVTTVAPCTIDGCVAVTWSLAAGPADVFATASGLTIDGASLDGIHGFAIPSVQDVDGDGDGDLVLVQPDGAVWIVRQVDGAVSTPEGWHVGRGLGGALAVGDADGDGDGDLFVTDATSRLMLLR